MDVKEIVCDGMDWIQLARVKEKWWVIVNMVMNLNVHG
jgi:hypothetical protein